MIKFILVFLVVAFALVAGIAVALNHFFGWKGLIAFPVILIAMVWSGKAVAGRIFKRFMLGLFSTKSQVLRGAFLEVHSVVSVSRPLEREEEIGDGAEPGAAGGDGEETDDEGKEEEGPKHYYAVDLTITPRAGSSSEVWEPGELILTSQKVSSLEDLQENEVGTADEVLVWNGSEFGEDDPGKYPGVQRLKITFAVIPGTSEAWLHYYNETIGKLDLPLWTSGNEPPRKRSTQRTARASRDSVAAQSEAQEAAAKHARRGADFRTGSGRAEPELTLFEPPDEEPEEPIDASLPMAEVDAALDRRAARRLDNLPMGASRFGGVPDLPPDLAWPVFRGRKLPFLAQIDLSALPKSVLPPDGWLFAFGLCHDDHNPTPIRLLHYRGPRAELVRAPRPADKDIWEDWTGNHIYSVVPLKATKEKEWEECGRLFGEIDEEGEDAAAVADSQDSSGDDWITLLVIPSVGSMMWSDCGLFHIAIRREDLARNDFAKVCAGLSCVG
jgi:hypothetical protein